MRNKFAKRIKKEFLEHGKIIFDDWYLPKQWLTVFVQGKTTICAFGNDKLRTYRLIQKELMRDIDGNNSLL